MKKLCLISDLNKMLLDDKFINYISNLIGSNKKILFIPTSPQNQMMTEKYGDEILSLFHANAIFFEDIFYLNPERSVYQSWP